MKQFLLLAGAAALASAAPSFAKPGHAKAQGKPQHAKVKIHDGDHDWFAPGIGGCPPGLAKKEPSCVPPGQAKKLGIGQRFPYGAQSLFGFDRLPYDIRNRSAYDPYGRYGYDNGYYYQVDPTTLIVRRIIDSVL